MHSASSFVFDGALLIAGLWIFLSLCVPADRRACGHCAGVGAERFTDIAGDLQWRRCARCHGCGWTMGGAR